MKRHKKSPEEPKADYRSLLIDLCKESGYEMYESFAGEQLLTVVVYTDIANRSFRGRSDLDENPYKTVLKQILYEHSLKTVQVV